MIIGAAWDIVSWCGVPRYLYNDLPLGNPLGHPLDTAAHRQSVEQALTLVTSATAPLMVDSGVTWSADDAWKANYMKIDDSNRELLRNLGEENRTRRAALKQQGLRRE